MRKARGMNGLLYIEPDVMNYTPAAINYNNPDTYVANDLQYGAVTTGAKKAWETYGFGPNRPVVADIDTGVRWAHEDLTDVVTHAFSWYYFADNGAVIAGNPLADPVLPDRLAESPNAASGGTDFRSGHGTHTAGTIAASGNNGKGVAGVCWNVDLVSYKGLADNRGGTEWTIFGSLWHLAKWKNEKVAKTEGGAPEPRYPHTIPVNMSIAGNAPSHFSADMMEMALEHGIVPICASGNDAAGFAVWPGSYTGCIRVGAVDQFDRRWMYSNWGLDLSVVAPGHLVWSTARDGNSGYEVLSGTSMATPHVTGLVGYMLTFAPDLKADQIKTYLEKNADPVDGQKGFSVLSGHGRINAYRTIGAVIDDMAANRAPESDYVMAPVKVRVKDASGRPVNGAKVWLFNLNEAGTIANYVAVTLTGESFVGVRDDAEIAPEPGVAWFNMLRAGRYKVMCNYLFIDQDRKPAVASAESGPFEVARGGAVNPIEIALDVGAE
jgi:thermitase